MDDGFLQGTLGDIIIHRSPLFPEKERQSLPVLEHVAHRLAQAAIGFHLLLVKLGFHPLLQVQHQWPAMRPVILEPRKIRHPGLPGMVIMLVDAGKHVNHVAA